VKEKEKAGGWEALVDTAGGLNGEGAAEVVLLLNKFGGLGASAGLSMADGVLLPSVFLNKEDCDVGLGAAGEFENGLLVPDPTLLLPKLLNAGFGAVLDVSP
jgi:hypothetical protein